MPCDRSTNRKHRGPAKNKVKLTSLQCRMASDIRAERQNSNVGRRPTYERKGLTYVRNSRCISESFIINIGDSETSDSEEDSDASDVEELAAPL
ncbi:hypothetical protein J6590_006261 [Homalodisca vitripennis]|nr:hypothetical protein J6590_006261 [Homalodisca vitripennis]